MVSLLTGCMLLLRSGVMTHGQFCGSYSWHGWQLRTYYICGCVQCANVRSLSDLVPASGVAYAFVTICVIYPGVPGQWYCRKKASGWLLSCRSWWSIWVIEYLLSAIYELSYLVPKFAGEWPDIESKWFLCWGAYSVTGWRQLARCQLEAYVRKWVADINSSLPSRFGCWLVLF